MKFTRIARVAALPLLMATMTAAGGASAATAPRVGSVGQPLYDLAIPASFANVSSGSSQPGMFSAVSCASPGNCSAAGQFFDGDGYEAMTATSTNGVWAPVVPAIIADVSGIPNHFGGFRSISCSAPGYCTAAGSIGSQAVTETSSNGVWGPVVSANFGSDLPRSPDGPNDHFTSISCTAVGTCTAVGDYSNENGYDFPMMESSTNGVWSPVVVASFPADFDSSSGFSFSAVSCSSPGNCAAVGSQFGWANGQEGFLASSLNGTWSTAVVVLSAEFNSVSCSAVGSCTSAGVLTPSNGWQNAVTVSSTNGVWAPVVASSINAGLLSPDDPESAFSSISCTAPGECTAVGTYVATNGLTALLLLTERSGVWAPAGAPSNVDANVDASPYLTSVSCSSPGNCSAAGSSFLNSASELRAASITETNGTWGPLVEASFAGGVSATSRGDFFQAISCGTAGSCTAVGAFADASLDGNGAPMVQSFRTPVPSPPVNVTAVAAPGHAIISWLAPLETYGAPITNYRITTRAVGAAPNSVMVSGTTNQVVLALPVGQYGVTVGAVGANGVGDASTVQQVSVPSAFGIRVPPAPRGLIAKPGNGQATLAWFPPVLSDGGSPIFQYVVTDGNGHECVSGNDARVASTKFRCVVSGLTNGRQYSFSVRAVNVMGASLPSPTKTVSPGSAPTSAPQVNLVSVTAHRATLNVTAPTEMGGRSLMFYQVSFDNGRTWLSLYYFTSGDRVVLGGLRPSTNYRVLINARNQLGVSPPAASSFVTPAK